MFQRSSFKYPVWVRLLFFTLMLYPSFLLRDFTPSDELKYLSIADEALRNRHWFVFYNHGVFYPDKPPLYLWLLMLARYLLGAKASLLIAFYSLIPMVGILVTLDRWMRELGLKIDPWIPNLLLLTTFLFLGSTLAIRMDLMMLWFIVLSLRSFFRIYRKTNSRADLWLFPVYVFLAIFTKGPVGILLPILSILVFLILKGQTKTLANYLGFRFWGVLLMLCSVWFAFVYREGGSEYLNDLIFHQTVGRAVHSTAHPEPVYYYAAHFLWLAAPWSLIYLWELYHSLRRKHKEDWVLFFQVIIGTSFVMLSLFSSKLEIYLLPIFPFLAYLTATEIQKIQGENRLRYVLELPLYLVCLAFPVWLTATFFPEFNYLKNPLIGAGSFALSAAAVWGLRSWQRNQFEQGIQRYGILFLLSVFLFSFAVPQLNSQIGLRSLAELMLQTSQQNQNAALVSYDYKKAVNMDVYTGKDFTDLESPEALDSLIQRKGNAVLLIKNKKLVQDSALVRRLSPSQTILKTKKFSVFLLKPDGRYRKEISETSE